ncbi:hypothetical protein Nepgr_026985 [Nepenthes gracilis]|uniref:Uncharacterized protein n=1 Tax=Nepenthes gracilis TaxID=150966 RepID=A0AAD3TAZ3_NEPGR|nr:hypothetical protein Nepgr_026985 [Nepenthes gracilis]
MFRRLKSCQWPENSNSRKMMPEEASSIKPRKQKSRRALIPEVQGDYMRGAQELAPSLPLKPIKKPPRKNPHEVSQFFHRQGRSTASELLESSAMGIEHRALRRKYLALEEESFTLGKQLRGVEDEIKVLEKEKITLLDQLVVLEGLIDTSDLPNP